MTHFTLSFVYFRPKYCFIKIMASLIYILLLLIVSSKIVASYHVQCNYDEHTKVLSIVGLKSSEDFHSFENYGIKCGEYDARTLEYACELLFRENKATFEKTTGELSNFDCEKEGSGIHVFGCDSGKGFRFHISLR